MLHTDDDNIATTYLVYSPPVTLANPIAWMVLEAIRVGMLPEWISGDPLKLVHQRVPLIPWNARQLLPCLSPDVQGHARMIGAGIAPVNDPAHRSSSKAHATEGAPPSRVRRPADGRGPLQRWNNTIIDLTDVPSEYAAWLEALSDRWRFAPLATV